MHKALMDGDFDVVKFSEYLKRLSSGVVAKRLIYLELTGLNVRIPSHLIKKGIVSLDPTMPKKGKTDHRLKLLINVELGE